MRLQLAPLVIAAALGPVACDQLAPLVPAGQLDCGGAAPELCDRLARAAIAEMNLVSTGPITRVVLEQVDCDRWARANFLSEIAKATGCWTADVTGERSHGGGTVVLWPDGSIQAFW